MTATEPAVSWMTRNDCGRAAVGVWNGVVSALDGAERCWRCGRWRRTVPEGTSACERGFQGQPVIEHYSGT
jgi:hypothetical protein